VPPSLSCVGKTLRIVAKRTASVNPKENTAEFP
jgi:hypothetical protein